MFAPHGRDLDEDAILARDERKRYHQRHRGVAGAVIADRFAHWLAVEPRLDEILGIDPHRQCLWLAGMEGSVKVGCLIASRSGASREHVPVAVRPLRMRRPKPPEIGGFHSRPKLRLVGLPQIRRAFFRLEHVALRLEDMLKAAQHISKLFVLERPAVLPWLQLNASPVCLGRNDLGGIRTRTSLEPRKKREGRQHQSCADRLRRPIFSFH